MSDLVERLREMGRYPRTHFHYQDGADIVVEAAAEIERLRTELAEQARLNGMGSEREAEAYRRGVEDAAKVADDVAAEKDVLATETPDDVDFVVYRQSAETAESIAAAIRSLTAPDKEGA